MFVDDSALVAILARERNAQDLSERLEADETAITSPIAIYEAVIAIARS